MFYFGDYIEPARDPDAAPWRWRWMPGETATVRFGARADRAASGIVRYSFAPVNGPWHTVTTAALPDAPAGHHLWQARIAPPPGEASCCYEIGYLGRDGTRHWSGRTRALLFTDAPLRTDAIADTGLRLTPGPENWRARMHYTVLIDRFAIGAPERQGLGLARHDPASPFAAHGGDLAGVQARLDYLADLGVGALILSPVAMNGPEGYHGYHPIDLMAVEPRLGTLADLRALVDAAHARDIAVLLDVVVNHTGPLVDWRREAERWQGTFRYDLAEPDLVALGPEDLRDPAHFHSPAHDGDPVKGRLFGFLDDWRTEDPDVRRALIATLGYWLAETDVDGFRYDAVRHAEPAFWRAVTADMRAMAHRLGKTGLRQYGEHASNDPADAGEAARAGGFDGMLDYPLYGAVQPALGGDAQAHSGIARRLDHDCFAWPDSRQNLAFLENHDTSRALGLLGGRREALAAWLAFLFLGPGIPMIAQGQEQEFTGQLTPWTTPDGRELISDAYVREDMFPNPACVWRAGPVNRPAHPPYDRQNPTFRLIAELAALRRRLPGLSGDRTPLRDASDGQHLTAMGAGADRLRVAVNLTSRPFAIRPPAAEPLLVIGTVRPDALGPFSAALWPDPE